MYKGVVLFQGLTRHPLHREGAWGGVGADAGTGFGNQWVLKFPSLKVETFYSG